MKKTLLALTSALLLAGAMGSTASAQSRHSHSNDRDKHGVDDRREHADSRDGDRAGDHRRDGRDDRHGSRDGRDDRYGSRDGRSDDHDNRGYRHDNGKHKGWAKQRYHAGRYQTPRNYAYRQYQVGSRLPMGYYGSSYYVNNSPYGLQAPPRGYRWNRVGNDVYLVNTNNGIIRDVLYSLFY